MAFVAKFQSSRLVHVFDCGNLSNQVLATIGQAFVSAQSAFEEAEVPEDLLDDEDGVDYEPCDDDVDEEYDGERGGYTHCEADEENNPEYALSDDHVVAAPPIRTKNARGQQRASTGSQGSLQYQEPSANAAEEYSATSYEKVSVIVW